jgi:tetratricopeptide (TPR) repeat protein
LQLADVALNGYQASTDKPKVLYDEVARTADYLLGKDPNSFDGLRLQADVLSLDGRLQDALGVYKKANTIRPMDPGVVYPMLQVLFQLKRAPEAEDLAKHFLQVHKDAGRIYDLLAAQYMQENRKPEAEELLKSKVANLPKDDRPLTQLADFYRQQQRLPEMSQALSRILNDSKDFPLGPAIVGDFYAGAGKPEEAIQEYKGGLKSSAKDRALYQKRIVKVLIGQQKRDAAIEALSEILKENPDDSDSRAARAILLRGGNDPKQLDLAMSDLNLLLVKNPNNETVRYNLGLVYMAKGDVKAGRAQLIESAKLNRNYLPPRNTLAEIAQRQRNYSEAIRYAEEVLAVDPGNADARLWHAAGLIGNKAYQQARAELNALLREHPDSVEINLHMAVLDTVEKKYREAETRYLRFYHVGQQDVRPLEGLIQVYGSEQHLDKALKLLDEELKQTSNPPLIHVLVASTAVAAGKLDLATQQYEWLRSNDPKSVQAYASLGDVYQLKGDVNSALNSYEKARELAPNDARIIAMQSYLQTMAGQDGEAIASLRKQLITDPENTIALNNLAFALADSETNLDEALALAQRAQKKFPGNPGIADTLGWVYTKKGLNDSAIQVFRGLLKRYPDDAGFRYHLGVALLQQGKPAEAKSEFIISLSKNPPKEMAEKIKQIIAKIG